MTSPSPLLFDTYYHIFNRGVNRENIFIEDRNYLFFLNLYAKHIEPVAQTFAYCLLRNHFHILVRIKSEEEIKRDLIANQTLSQTPGQTLRILKTLRVSAYPSKKFSDFFNAYAKAINSATGRVGSLFQHPFGRVMVTNDHQFWSVIAYIHQNPQKHSFVKDFREWKWSSYEPLLMDKPTRLQRETVLDWFGGKLQYKELHAQWVEEAQARWLAVDDED